MANYAHNPNGSVTHGRNPEIFADNTLFAEGMPRQVFIDDYHRLAPLAIVFIEETSLAQRNAHDFQVIGLTDEASARGSSFVGSAAAIVR